MTSANHHYCRVSHNGTSHFGMIVGDQVQLLSQAPWLGGKPTGETCPHNSAALLTPVAPGKTICVGRNYRSHIKADNLPTEPGLFLKLPNTLIGPGDPIPLPSDAEGVQNEGEMVLVIGETARNVSRDDAKSKIFGITCGHDVSVRPWQRGDLQWVRAKSSDGFGPVGPVIVTGLDPDDLLLESRVDGEVLQSERTSMLIFDCAEVISYVSRYMTLEPGDIIFTGTPGQAPDIAPGCTVSVTVEGVGTLENPVVAKA